MRPASRRSPATNRTSSKQHSDQAATGTQVTDLCVPAPVAKAYTKSKWSVVPQSQDKSVYVKWKEFQEHRPSPGQMREWGLSYPAARWAVVTGQVSGLVVLDFDGPTGVATMDRLGLQPFVRTPRGGAHVYVTAPDFAIRGAARVDQNQYPNMDLLADGRLATFYGKDHIRGSSYEKAEGRKRYLVEELPQELQQLLRDRRQKERKAPAELPHDFTDFATDDVLLRDALDAVDEGAPRNGAGFALACQLRDERYDPAQAELVMVAFAEAVTDAGDHPYLPQEAYDSLVSAYGSPARSPRSLARKRNESRFSLRSMADVEPQDVRWFWPGRIPFGKITNFEGDPEHGKSLTTLDLAARTSSGRPFPDDATGAPCAVLLICDEDDYEDTIVPRLIAAGADRGHIFALHPDKDADGKMIPFFMPDDLPDLEKHINALKARTGRSDVVVIVDPVTAVLNERINSGVDASVRRALSPLAELARVTGAAIILVRHLNKNSQEKNVKYRGGGSIGFFGAARTVLLFGAHPDDPSMVVLAVSKNNLGPKAPSLAYRVESWDQNPAVPIIQWKGEVDLTADTVLNGRDGRTASPERDLAMKVIDELLDANDGSVRADVAIKECKKAGASEKTAQRAKADMGLVVGGVRSETGDGKYDHWTWSRPVAGTKVRIQAQVPDVPR